MKLSLSDIPCLFGFGVASYGFWLAWPPLGWIFAGMMLVVMAVAHEWGPPKNADKAVDE